MSGYETSVVRSPYMIGSSDPPIRLASYACVSESVNASCKNIK